MPENPKCIENPNRFRYCNPCRNVRQRLFFSQSSTKIDAMKEPKLPLHHFIRDRIVLKECLIPGNRLNPNGTGMPFSSSSGLLRIPVTCPGSDLSRFNQISFSARNISSSPIYAEMKLFHGTGKTHAIDTPVSLSGGREILLPGRQTELNFPAGSFGTYGLPDGWKHITSIEILFKPDKTAPRSDAIIVETGAIFGERRIIPHGPRLTSEGLSAMLKKGSHPLTERLVPYSMDYPHGLSIPPPHDYPREQADDILEGRIMGRLISRPIPWNHSPIGVLEWTHFLNRHHFFKPVILALGKTGHPRYAKYLEKTVCNWISSSPVPVDSNGGAGPGWETLSAAWRLREWLWIRGIVWPCPSFRISAREMMLRSFWEHARHLMDHQGHPNNWMIVESGALALSGMCLSEFQEADTWVEEGIRRLEIEFNRQFMDDGVHYEFSPLYQAICLESFLEVKRVAAIFHVTLPDVFGAPLEKAFEYLSTLCRPDFSWPSFNDSGGVTRDYTTLMGLAGKMFHRADFDWIASKGVRGTCPSETTRVFPDAGMGIMRSGFDPQSHFLVFRAGPPGMTHVHEDALSLDVTAHGIPCLVDPGITHYAPGPMTDGYRSASAHNMLLLDGRGPIRSGLGIPERIRSSRNQLIWINRGDICGMTGICRNYRDDSGAVFHITRSVLFVDARYWVIRDTAMGAGLHTLTACWQFFPGNVEMDAKTRIIRSIDHPGKGLVLIPYAGFHHAEVASFTGCRNPYAGWTSIDGKDTPACHFRFSVRGMLPITLDWILCPVSIPYHEFWNSPDFISKIAGSWP